MTGENVPNIVLGFQALTMSSVLTSSLSKGFHMMVLARRHLQNISVGLRIGKKCKD